MKVLGVVQTQQMKHNFLGFEGKYKATFGDLPDVFQCIIYGKSGQGKTEMGVQFAKYLTDFGRVLWLSYEQGHGADLQSAINRNKMEEVSGRFLISDPLQDLRPGITLLEDLVEYLDKRDSPEFIFVDSVDYTRFKKADYLFLKNRYNKGSKKKGFVWLGHGQGKGHRSVIGEDIHFDGHIAIWVDKYIGHVVKNRFNAAEPYVVYPERARILNPQFFDELEKQREKAAKAGG